MKASFTEKNTQHFYGSLAENVKGIKNFAKEMRTAFNKIHINEEQFFVMNFRKVNFVPGLLINTCMHRYILLLQFQNRH